MRRRVTRTAVAWLRGPPRRRLCCDRHCLERDRQRGPPEATRNIGKSVRIWRNDMNTERGNRPEVVAGLQFGTLVPGGLRKLRLQERQQASSPCLVVVIKKQFAPHHLPGFFQSGGRPQKPQRVPSSRTRVTGSAYLETAWFKTAVNPSIP